MSVQPRLASTVMLLRDSEGEGIEVFMVRRVVQSEFMPNLYVFPGGSVSGDDHNAEQTEGVCRAVPETSSDPEGRTALGSGVRAAALRELFEEANILLASRDDHLLVIDQETIARFAEYRSAFNSRQGSLVEMARQERLTLATDQLAYFAHWITPEGMPKRYDTHFFLGTAPVGQEAIYDDLETSEGLWVRPAEALKGFESKTFPVAFPTFHQLRDLAAFSSVREALETARERYVPTHMPNVVLKDGKPYQVYLPEDPDHMWTI